VRLLDASVKGERCPRNLERSGICQGCTQSDNADAESFPTVSKWSRIIRVAQEANQKRSGQFPEQAQPMIGSGGPRTGKLSDRLCSFFSGDSLVRCPRRNYPEKNCPGGVANRAEDGPAGQREVSGQLGLAGPSTHAAWRRSDDRCRFCSCQDGQAPTR